MVMVMPWLPLPELMTTGKGQPFIRASLPAAAAAADERVDSRIMYTVGKAAEEMGYVEGPVIWHGIPLSVTGKSIFFDRKA